MKYFIQFMTPLLLTLNLNANETITNHELEPNFDDSIIIPEYFSSKNNQTLHYIEEDSISFPNDTELNNNIISQEPEMSISNQVTKELPVITEELPTIVESTKDIIIPEPFQDSTTETISTVKIENHTLNETIEKDSSLVDSDTDIPNDSYTGYYKFVQGTTGMQTMTETLHDGFLVIEKLDDNDFGFYYVIQKQNKAPTDRYGIFHYKNGRFFQKFIGDPILRDNIEVKKLNIELETIIKDDRGEHAIQWIQATVDDISMLNQELQKSLTDTKENYRQIYKEKFTN